MPPGPTPFSTEVTRRRKRRVLLSAVTLLGSIALPAISNTPAGAHAKCHEWIGPATVTQDKWNFSGSWDGGVPSTADDVCFSNWADLFKLNVSVRSVTARNGLKVLDSTLSTYAISPVFVGLAVAQDLSGWKLSGVNQLNAYSFSSGNAGGSPAVVTEGLTTLNADTAVANLGGSRVIVSGGTLNLQQNTTSLPNLIGVVDPAFYFEPPTQTFEVTSGQVNGLNSTAATVKAARSSQLNGVIGTLTTSCPTTPCSTVVSTTTGLRVADLQLSSAKFQGTTLSVDRVSATTDALIDVDRFVSRGSAPLSYVGKLNARQNFEIGAGQVELAGTSTVVAPINTAGQTGAFSNIGTLTIKPNNTPTTEGTTITNRGILKVDSIVTTPRTNIVNTGSLVVADGGSLRARNLTSSGTISFPVNPFLSTAAPRIESTGTNTLSGNITITTPMASGAASWLAVTGAQRSGFFTSLTSAQRPVSLLYTINGVLVRVN
jgi:hypothetical protein